MKRKFVTILIVLLLVLCVIGLVCCQRTENVTLENGNFVFEKICDKVLDSCVKITCGKAGGSGVIVSEDGYILTNDHVVENASEAIIHIVDKKNPDRYFEYSADVVAEISDGSDYEKIDLALLKIRGNKKFVPVEISTQAVNFGDYGVMVGNPKQIGILCAKAMVANPKILIKNNGVVFNHIALDAAVNTGNSGGGFFDANGKLAGIVSLRHSSGDKNSDVVFGIGYAIPSNYVEGYLARYGF